MMRELLSALALIFTLSGVPVCAADSSPSRPTQLAQSQPAESACQADCRTKFDTCKSDCYTDPKFADSEFHKQQCTRVCDFNFNGACVQRCN